MSTGWIGWGEVRWVESEKRFVPDIIMKIIAKVLAVSYEEILDK